MNENAFQTVTDSSLIELIEKARSRLVFIAPGVRITVAKALVDAAHRLPGSVTVILDVDAEVCRLGYGDIEGLKCLQEIPGLNGNVLNAQSGVRIGVVIADDDTLFYSPTPLLIEAEPSSADARSDFPVSCPNGVMIRKSVPSALACACSANGDYAKREVGLDPVKNEAVEKAAESLKKIPPKRFDLARRERVFSSKLCFMELEMRDYKLTSKALPLPSELFVADDETKRRLKNRFRVFDKDRLPKDVKYGEDENAQILSMELIEKMIADLRSEYLVNVGEWGTVIVCSRLQEFKDKVAEVVKMLKFYKETVTKDVTDIALNSCAKLAEEIAPRLIANPPRILSSQLSLAADDDEKVKIIRDYIAMKCEGEIRSALRDFNPKTTMIEKAITYDTFTNPQFIRLLERPAPLGFGKDCIKKILEEHDSVREA